MQTAIIPKSGKIRKKIKDENAYYQKYLVFSTKADPRGMTTPVY